MMKPKYELRVAHLYGDLMNTYGDYGNIINLKYYGRKMGIQVDSNVVSIDDDFKAKDYDIVILGDGQYFEQSIVANDLPKKSAQLAGFINDDKPMLAVGEGFQLLGEYYMTPQHKRINGAGILDYSSVQYEKGHDFVGKIEITNPKNNQTYHGFEHHQDQTFLTDDDVPLGQINKNVNLNVGNNEESDDEGVQYKNTYGTYIHSFLARNPNVDKQFLLVALKKKYPNDDFSKLAKINFSSSY